MLNLEKFKSVLQKTWAEPSQKRFLLAVSGGADSMVLAHLFQESRLYFEIAHINYKLRGEDSEKDKELVESFCKKNNIKFHLYEVTAQDQKPDNSIQVWARELRYNFFEKIIKQERIDTLVTAHHLNDEFETFFINLIRGTGLKGLSGMPNNDNIFRPLLSFSKQEIYDFTRLENISFREDQSNKKNDYLRNKIRNTLVPKIEEIKPDFINNFQTSISYLKTANEFIQTEIDKAFASISQNDSDKKIRIEKDKFLSLNPFIQKEIILRLGFRGEEIEKIISAETGKMFRSRTYELFISKKYIICEIRGKIKS